MKHLVIFLGGVLGLVAAAPQYRPSPVASQPQYQAAPVPPAPRQQPPSQESYARILKQDQDTQFDGNFNYAYETENGIASSASGTLKNPGTEAEAQVITGSYSWRAPDGTPITIRYIADEEGFRAEGDAIPTPPPIPEAIARALDYIRSLPPQPQQQ